MANYVIEGVVTELSIDNEGKLTSFKIYGSDGYVLRKKKKEKIEKFNVLCEDNDGAAGIIFKNDTELKCIEAFSQVLLQLLSTSNSPPV